MIWELVLLIIGSYLLGAIPTGYIVTRRLRGVDIREYGSGGIGGANVWHAVSRWTGVLVVFIDMLKGAIPVAIALLVGMPLAWAIAGGLTAIIGHNWSIFLRFRGGRGIGVSLGVLGPLFSWGLLLFFAIMALFAIIRNIPLGIVLTITAIPFACWAMGGEPTLVYGLGAIALLMLIRRITAGRFPEGTSRREVLIYRLLYDRDVRGRDAWVKRASNDGDRAQ